MSISVVNLTTAFFTGVVSPQTVTIPSTTAGNTLVILGQFQPTLGNFTTKLGTSSFSVYTGGGFTDNQGNNAPLLGACQVLQTIAGGHTSVTISCNGFFGVIGWFAIYELTPCNPISLGGVTWNAQIGGGTPTTAASTTVQPPALTGTGVSSGNFGLLYFTTAAWPSGCTGPCSPIPPPSPLPTVIDSGWSLDAAYSPGNMAGANMYGFGVASQSLSGSSSHPTLTTSPAMQSCSISSGCGAGGGGVSGALVTFGPIVTPVKNTLTGGNFQKADGAPIANGKLVLQLSHDENYTSMTANNQVVAGLKVSIPLDSNGNVSGSPQIWPNDVVTPAGSFYLMQVYTADGAQAWTNRHTLTVPSSPNPFPITTGIDLS